MTASQFSVYRLFHTFMFRSIYIDKTKVAK